MKLAVFLLTAIALAIAGCGSQEAVTTATHTARLSLGKDHAEVTFHRAVAEIAKGGIIKMGRIGSIETDCEPEGTHWGCSGWFVAETGEYCFTVSADVTNAGRVTKEHIGKIPLGEPGGPECKI